MTYAYFPVFKRTQVIAGLDETAVEAGIREWEELLAKHSGRVEVRGVYTAAGFRPDADLLFWWVAPSADDHQSLLSEIRRTSLGRGLELTHAFLGVHRPPEFNADHIPAFMRGEAPRRYLSVYPFVRSPDWYLLPREERAALLAEHGRLGREFPDVLPNTTSAFGLGDWEWILAFEADELERIVDCIRRLREAEARKYFTVDVPFVVGIRKALPEVVRDVW